MNSGVKVLIITILTFAVLLWVNSKFGFEKADLLGFALLIGLSCASLKSGQS